MQDEDVVFDKVKEAFRWSLEHGDGLSLVFPGSFAGF